MGSLDVDAIFTNIPLDKTIDICIRQLYLKTLILFKVLQSQNLNNCYVWLQRSPILYLTVYFTNNSIV